MWTTLLPTDMIFLSTLLVDETVQIVPKFVTLT